MEVFQPSQQTISFSRPKAAKRRIVRTSVGASHLLRSRFPGAGSDLGRALQKTVTQCKITKRGRGGGVGGGGGGGGLTASSNAAVLWR